VLIGDDAQAMDLGAHLRERGFAVGAIRPPTVPAGAARLRLSLKAQTRGDDLEMLLDEMDAWRAAHAAQP
jgi:8-amino-7-oxononanoate synthase